MSIAVNRRWADKMTEECGVFGLYAPGSDVARLTYYALYALQHRGQESAGIAVADGKTIRGEKGPGLVGEVFADTGRLKRLPGHIALGHVRHAGNTADRAVNALPLVIRYRYGSLAIAHNGNLTNGRKLRQQLETEGSIFQTATDSEIVAHLVARSGEKDLATALKSVLPKVQGAYAFILMTADRLIGLRDPHGIRPLSLGKTASGYALASETCAFDTIGAEFVRDVKPGEMVIIDENGLRSEHFAPPAAHAMCIFEFIYFARPDSNLVGKNVHLVRKQLGRRLAQEHPVEADLVAGVPDSSLSVASGVAEQLDLPYEMGFNINRYIGRTFIKPSQELRSLGVQLKLNPVRQIVEGKRVVIVDDSIVRGTTSRHIVEMLRRAGAKEVHMRISSPPVIAPCCYGLEISSSTELIAARLSVPEIAASIGADSLGFLSEEGLLAAVGLPDEGFCQACFNGCYPEKPADGPAGEPPAAAEMDGEVDE